MTCRHAAELMERVLNDEMGEDDADGLREHLERCGDCAEAWHAAWQVRSVLAECDPPDPGEAYFEDATRRIMERIGSLQRSGGAAADGLSAIESMRYGPLSIRGTGAAFVFALAVLLGSLLGSPSEVRPRADDTSEAPVRWLGCGAHDGSAVHAGLTLDGHARVAGDHDVDAREDADGSQRGVRHNLQGLLQRAFGRLSCTPPPPVNCIPPPCPASS